MFYIPSSVVKIKKQINDDENKNIINIADSPEYDSEATTTTTTTTTTTAVTSKRSEEKEKTVNKKKRNDVTQEEEEEEEKKKKKKKKVKEPSPLDVEVNAVDGLDSSYTKYALSFLPPHKRMCTLKEPSSLSASGKRCYYLSSFFVSSKYLKKITKQKMNVRLVV